MHKPLSAKAIENHLRRPPKVRTEFADGGCRGLRLLVHPTGRASWVMRFRQRNGHAKMTLGTVDLLGGEAEPVLGGHLTLAAARRLATWVQQKRALGRDPAADRQLQKRQHVAAAEQRARESFGAAARAFVEEHARPNTRRWQDTAQRPGPAADRQ